MKKTLSIPTISCGHCLMSIKRELGFVDGVDYIDGNVDAKTVLVEYSDESHWIRPARFWPKPATRPRTNIRQA